MANLYLEWQQYRILDSVETILDHIYLPVIFGFEIADDPGFCRGLKSYISSLEAYKTLLSQFPVFLRPVVWRLSATCRSLRFDMMTMRKHLVPGIQSQIKQEGNISKVSDNISFIQSMVEQATRNKAVARGQQREGDLIFAQKIADSAVFTYMETVPSIAMVVALMLFQIIRSPEYATPLREEIEQAIRFSNGEWGFETAKYSPKLESFTKEILRLYTTTTCKSS